MNHPDTPLPITDPARPARILVTGDRSWYCIDLARRVLDDLVAINGRYLVIVHGDASGVDAAFDGACEELGIAVERHPADWDRLGNAAGPIRNQEMVRRGAALALAVHADLPRSKGTRDCVFRCIGAGIDVYAIREDTDPVTMWPITRVEDLCLKE